MLLEERTRWAMRIHDGLTQSVTSAILELQSLRHQIEIDPKGAVEVIAHIENEIREDLRRIRELLFEMTSETPASSEPALAQPASPRELFFTFNRLALQGFGGVLAIAQHELVERQRWLTRQQFVDNQISGLSSILNILYVLLALSVIVSLFGIVNTLVLTVFERTRELGMLRAIGMTRRQVRRMIRHESIVTALIGAALGIGVGMFLAAKLRRSNAIGAMPIPPPTRIAPAAPGASSRGAENELPSGPLTQTFSPGSSSQRRSVPGPMPSIRKSRRTPPAAGPVSATERARGKNGRCPLCSQWRSAASM